MSTKKIRCLLQEPFPEDATLQLERGDVKIDLNCVEDGRRVLLVTLTFPEVSTFKNVTRAVRAGMSWVAGNQNQTSLPKDIMRVAVQGTAEVLCADVFVFTCWLVDF